jgi:hypothetical protein
MVDTLSTSDARQDMTLFILSIFGNNNGDRLTDRLSGSMAEDALGASVPACDYAVEILAYDRVVARFDDGCQPTQPLLSLVKGKFDLLAVGNIAIDLKHGVAQQLHPAVDGNLPPVFADMTQFACPLAGIAKLGAYLRQ